MAAPTSCGGPDGGAEGGDGGATGVDGGDRPDAGADDCPRVVHLGAASDHTCVVREDRSLWCWGANDRGQLGLGADAGAGSLHAPVRVGMANDWLSVTAGVDYTCGLRTPGSLWCWGRNDYGQLGTGDEVDRDEPVRVGSEDDWEAVRAGPFHACGLRGGATLHCWGHNANGRLGTGDMDDRAEPTAIAAPAGFSTVAPGGSHTCAIGADGSLSCWGSHSDGQLGLGDSAGTGSFTEPQAVGEATDWARVSAGASHSCGAHADGTLECWGSNGVGQLGLGADGPSRATSPATVSEERWLDVMAGSLRTCAIRQDGAALCWGGNGRGQLGTGDTARRDDPAAVAGEVSWAQIAGGSRHTCGLDDGGALRCWGANDDGQLGLGHSADQLVPAAVCVR